MSAAVTAPAGGLNQDCSILPLAPFSKGSLQTGAARHRNVKATRSTHQQANKTKLQPSWWSIRVWLVCSGDDKNRILGAMSLKTYDSC